MKLILHVALGLFASAPLWSISYWLGLAVMVAIVWAVQIAHGVWDFLFDALDAHATPAAGGRG